jgi:hypothetical protein
MSDSENSDVEKFDDNDNGHGHDNQTKNIDTDNEDEDVEAEDIMENFKPAKKAKNLNKFFKYVYTSDGLPRNEYKKSDCANQNLTQVECCQNYFKKDALAHKTEYNLEIQGIETCIHCYISFNSQKFADCKDLTPDEAECLKYYIENFTKTHNPTKCSRSKYNSKCFLCEALLGRKPKICTSVSDVEIVDTVIDNSSDKFSKDTKFVLSDVILIDETESGKDFVLIL